MANKVNRREFVLSGAAAVVAASVKPAGAQAPPAAQAPTMMVKKSVKPVIIAVMAMNIMTEMVTPAMQTRDWRRWARRYLIEMNQRMRLFWILDCGF